MAWTPPLKLAPDAQMYSRTSWPRVLTTDDLDGIRDYTRQRQAEAMTTGNGSGHEEIMVSLSITTDDADGAARAVETLSRSVVGFALEGMYASLTVTRVEDEEDESS